MRHGSIRYEIIDLDRITLFMATVLANIPRLVLFFFLICTTGCLRHAVSHDLNLKENSFALIKKNTSLVFIPEKKRIAAHILYSRTDRFAFGASVQGITLTRELAINPLMRNPALTARVEKNGKVVREIVATKSAQSLLNDKRSAWLPTRSKLVLMVPFISEDEQVVVTTSYEWMDKRWLPPIFLQEEGAQIDTELTVDVPYGISMRFKVAKNRTSFDYVPVTFPVDRAAWIQDLNRGGLGTRFTFSLAKRDLVPSSVLAEQLQVFLSFETPAQVETGIAQFDRWDVVSSYLYNRIDRYDMPSNEIRTFTAHETKGRESKAHKVARIFSILRNDIEIRNSEDPFLDQPAQPATRTLARKYGSPFDVAILGKAMLSSIGVEADLVAVGDSRFNPKIVDFYSPSLFSTVILAARLDDRVVYFDPEHRTLSLDQLRPSLQGQSALLIRPKNGSNFSLPYDDAHKNTKTLSYQLWMTEDGFLEGEYSIDLVGYEAQALTSLPVEEQNALSPEILESKLLGATNTAFSLASVTREHTSLREFRIYGETKRRMLARNEKGVYDFSLDTLIAPALDTLKNGAQKGYSSVTRISLFLTLPPGFVAHNLPKNVNFQLDGISGRFSASFAHDQLVVEGIGLVSLPIKDPAVTNSNVVNQLKLFGEQMVNLGNQAILSGTMHGTQKSNQTKDS